MCYVTKVCVLQDISKVKYKLIRDLMTPFFKQLQTYLGDFCSAVSQHVFVDLN